MPTIKPEKTIGAALPLTRRGCPEQVLGRGDRPRDAVGGVFPGAQRCAGNISLSSAQNPAIVQSCVLVSY